MLITKDTKNSYNTKNTYHELSVHIDGSGEWDLTIVTNEFRKILYYNVRNVKAWKRHKANLGKEFTDLDNIFKHYKKLGTKFVSLFQQMIKDESYVQE